MSRTSTDGGRVRSDARFRRALTVTVVALLVLCGGFLALGYAQGPKLSSAQVDTAAVVLQGGQQLRLFANQAVAQVDADQVTIVPATEFTVSTSNDVIAVQFAERLRYDTHYRVQVSGVTSPSLAQHSTLQFDFSTASPESFYLDRGSPDDEIVKAGVSGSGRDVVYSAPGIQDFVRAGKALVVSAAGEDGANTLALVTEDGATEGIPLPEAGTIGQLDAATSSATVGFILVPAGGDTVDDAALYTIDLDAERVAAPVLGLDGSPLHVLQWFFVPGTANLVALTVERTLVYVDAESGTALPLGQFQSLLSVAPDGQSVVVTDAFGPLVVAIADGSQERLALSPLDGTDGADTFTGATELLSSGGRISKAVVVEGGRYAVVLLLDDGTTSSILYRTVDDAGSIEDFSVSPNGQYVAVEVVPDQSVSTEDGYEVNGRSTSITTLIIEIDSGSQPRSVEGFDWRW